MPTTDEWNYSTIGLWVTGRGEEEFLPAFFRSIETTGRCHVVVRRRIGQLSPRSTTKKLKMVGKGQLISSRQEEFALNVRGFLQQSPSNYAVVIDDLEERQPNHKAVFDTYREPLDRILRQQDLTDRASVQFFVPMVEAYFLADAQATQDALGISIDKIERDPETIRGPKGKLKNYCLEAGQSFNERLDGAKIAGRIDLDKVLGNPDHCISLRSLVKWCSRRIGEKDTTRFQLLHGKVCNVTGPQIDNVE